MTGGTRALSICLSLLMWGTASLLAPPVAADEPLVSAAGYRLVFDAAGTPGLEAPDGGPVAGSVNEHLAGPRHWFEWLSHPSWRYDALRQWTGGAACCMWYWFVSKDPPYRALPLLDGVVDDIRLVDADGDGVMELETLEDTYSFGTDGAHRTTPRLLWRMTGSGPELARDLMRAWLLDDARLEALAGEIAKLAGTAYYGKWVKSLTTNVITQYYASGDLEIARAAFDQLWPQSETDREWWWARIVVQLRCSPYGLRGFRCDQ